jgi:hypothetical protein
MESCVTYLTNSHSVQNNVPFGTVQCLVVVFTVYVQMEEVWLPARLQRDLHHNVIINSRWLTQWTVIHEASVAFKNKMSG